VLQAQKTLHRKDAKDAKKDKGKRENAIFRNKIGFSSLFSSSLRPSRLCGANFFHSGMLSFGRGNTERFACA
jgi:hypothetical protein